MRKNFAASGLHSIRSFLRHNSIKLLFGVVFFVALHAQTIITVAVLPYSHRAAVDSQQAINAPLRNVYGLTFDRLTGRLLFHNELLVYRREPHGSLSSIVGVGRNSPDGDTVDGTLASDLNIWALRGLAQE